MTGLTPLLCQPESSLRSFAQRQEGAVTQPRAHLVGTGSLRRVLQSFTQTTKQQRGGGGRKKVTVMLRARGQILFCRGNSGTRRKCRLIKNGLCKLKFASLRAQSICCAPGCSQSPRVELGLALRTAGEEGAAGAEQGKAASSARSAAQRGWAGDRERMQCSSDGKTAGYGG